MAESRKRLALFVGQPDEYFQSRFITGFTKTAFEYNMDVCVFAMFKKYQDTVEREKGDSNIFTLARPDFFDGIVILKDTIQTANAAEELEKRLKEKFKGPVIVVDKESEYYQSIFIDGFTPVAELTKHLIEVHGCKDIAFLTGKKWHRHSKERQSAFEEEMQRHGLTVPADRIIEGDFWYKSGEQCLDYLYASGKKLPEAVICANDQMAIGLCKALFSKGIKVPEDMIVLGCDSAPEGQTSPKSLTSYISPAEEFGRYALECVLDIAASKELKKFEGKARIVIGESCGCPDINMPSWSMKRSEWDTVIYEEGYESIFNTMFENLLNQTSVMDYISTVYSYAYQIKGADSFNLMLVNGVKYMASGSKSLPKNEGYPGKMIHAIRHTSDHMDDMVGLDESFDSFLMLPELSRGRDKPSVYFFNPVFYEDYCFGYAVLSYKNQARVYDEVYRKWLGTVSRGFESLRRYLELEATKDKLDKLKVGKFDKTEIAYDSLTDEEKEDYEAVRDILDSNQLRYFFQPIVSAVDGSIYSYEALMRSDTSKNVPPLTIIKYAGMMDRLSDVESATFKNVLEIIEKNKDKIGDAKVFINSIPGVRVKDEGELEKKLSLNSNTVVVELTEEAELKDDDLGRLKEFFHRVNVEVAVDDYGTGYSNVNNLLRYMPDYVKIDRSLMGEIQNKPQKQHFVREIINFCHDSGIKALAEGVETSEEMRMVIHLGVDLIQGFYTAKPVPFFLEKIDENVINEIRDYQQERSDGKTKRIYIAGKTNRVSLLSLEKDECTDIVIGREGMVYKDITIVGMPALQTNLHIRIEAGYKGRITLENVYLSNLKNRPVIELGDKSDVVCIVEGHNVLHDGGILVPESARFALEGNGNLLIDVDSQEYFGIGNDKDSKHGDITFLQDGKLTIKSNGTTGVGIGSGLGGNISILSGVYQLNINGNYCVGVGSLYADSSIMIRNCSIETDISVSEGAAVGSISGSTKVKMEKCFFKVNGDGRKFVGVGSIGEASTSFKLNDSFAEFVIGADISTCIGSLEGSADIDIGLASLRVESAGEKAIMFGGYNENSKVLLHNVDTRAEIHNSLEKDTYIKEEDYRVENGRYKVAVNDNQIDRKINYTYSDVLKSTDLIDF